MIDKFIRPQIKNMTKIKWGEIPENSQFRLMFGENQTAIEQCVNAIVQEACKLNFYPNPVRAKLKNAIAKYNNILPENIIVTNGSDDAIELIAKVFVDKDDEIIIPSPTFPVYESACIMMGAKIIKIPLGKDFSFELQTILSKITNSTKIIWIANPNNPTGNILIPQDQIEKFIQKIPNCLLVFDECYFELTNITAINLINKYDNLIIIRSFSKIFSLAGARLGYIAANQKITSFCNMLQQNNQPFSVNRFAIAAGSAIFEKNINIRQLVNNYQDLKSRFEILLKKITAIDVIPTKTTFCLIKLPKTSNSKKLKAKLEAKGIFIKGCSIYEGLGNEFVYLGVPNKTLQKRVVFEINRNLYD